MARRDTKLIREGELLFLVVDGERVLEGRNGQWNAAAPGWSVANVELWGPGGEKWNAFEFSHDGKPLDTVFHVDSDGNPHAVGVTSHRPMPRA